MLSHKTDITVDVIDIMASSHWLLCLLTKTMYIYIYCIDSKFDSIYRAKMAQILKSYGIPMKIINAIMILYRDTQSILRSSDGDT